MNTDKDYDAKIAHIDPVSGEEGELTLKYSPKAGKHVVKLKKYFADPIEAVKAYKELKEHWER